MPLEEKNCMQTEYRRDKKNKTKNKNKQQQEQPNRQPPQKYVAYKFYYAFTCLCNL